jgi:hypothetical protein
MDILDNLFMDDDDGLALAFLLSIGVFSVLPGGGTPRTLSRGWHGTAILYCTWQRVRVNVPFDRTGSQCF